MNTFMLDTTIEVAGIKATAFPEGIAAAHHQVKLLCETQQARDFFGISQPDKQGNIVYFAAVVLPKNEMHLTKKTTPLLVKSGKYAYIDVAEFSKNLEQITLAFNTLLYHPNLDRNGSCVEWYRKNGVCRCMVRLTD